MCVPLNRHRRRRNEPSANMYTIQRRPPRRTGRRRQWRTDSGCSDGGCIPARQRAVFSPKVDESFTDANHDCFSSVDEDYTTTNEYAQERRLRSRSSFTPNASQKPRRELQTSYMLFTPARARMKQHHSSPFLTTLLKLEARILSRGNFKKSITVTFFTNAF